MAKKTVNSDIYNLSQLVDDVKSVFIPDETDETLAIGTYGYIGALESHRLQTQVQMTGELCNESFPSRARLERNIITHAIMTNIEDINAKPSKMTVFISLREKDIDKYLDERNNIFTIDRECPIYIGDYEFHLEYDVKLTRIYSSKEKSYSYTARYDIPSNRDVPTSSISNTEQYLSPPAVIQMTNEEGYPDSYIMITVVISQVQHTTVSKKLVTSNIIDNKIMNFDFQDQLAYFEIHCAESDQDYYITPVFEGSAIPESNAQYYCWYQYIDTNLIRIRFDRKSYMPGLNAMVECLIKTTKGNEGNFKYGEDIYVNLESSIYGYKGITALLTPVSEATGGKDRKSKKELQALIPKEALSRGSLTTITDLNNYFSMLDSEYGRIVIQKKIDNQIERVYYSYFVAKDQNGDVIPSNTVDVKVEMGDLVYSKPSDSDSPRYLLKSGACFRLGDDGIAYINHLPLLGNGYSFTPKAVSRGSIIEDTFIVTVTKDGEYKEAVSCAVDVGGCQTETHIFPKDKNERFDYVDSKDEVLVEDFIQMGTGKSYIYSAEYTAKENNALITVRDKNFDCLDFEDAWYTANGETKHFNSLPITVYNLEKGTKVFFYIKRKLNEKACGVTYFTLNDNQYALHQKKEVEKLSSILGVLGITVGEITEAVSEDESIIVLTETGTVGNGSSAPEEGVILGYNRKVVSEDQLPDIKNRKENEWYAVVEGVEGLSQTSEKPFKQDVQKTENLPDIEDREENQWEYGINLTKDENGVEIDPTIEHSDEDYTLTVAKDSEIPDPVDRPEGSFWYRVTGSEKRAEIPDDPDIPVVPTELSGKEYSVSIVGVCDDNPVYIDVTVEGVQYKIAVMQDRFLIENVVYVTEGNNDTQRTKYKAYTPVLDQDKWPEELIAGDKIKYTIRYKSISNTYTPNIIIKLSEGLEYEPFSNKIFYSDGSSYGLEPIEVSLEHERGFIYTNPYAANINANRLYSAFYMMSMEENPYLHFDHINEKSNIQFISTNAYWTRPFSGDDKDNYKLKINLTQSVQADLGLDPNYEDLESPPLIKVLAVFRRNGKDYRYRSLNFDPYDPDTDKSTYSYTFTQSFNSMDKFDADNNIEIRNVQVASQAEYVVTMSYEDQTYPDPINNGASVLLSELLNKFGIEIEEIDYVKSSTSGFILTPIYVEQKLSDYKITSVSDFSGTESIEMADKESNIYIINATSTQPSINEYGYINPTSEMKIYVLCGLPDIEGKYSKDSSINSICPGLTDWTLTNIYDVVNGVTMYHNYSEIMGSRVTPFGKDLITEGPELLGLEGFYIKSVPMFGYDYCQNEYLVQSAINALNYRKFYIDSTVNILENSFGVDFKLFNTYGPSRTYYIIKDRNANNFLDDDIEFIDKVNLTLYFRIKLVAENDSYTRSNIIEEIKSYIEDLDDLGELHIPNLVTQITTNYREQISYFEYLGFNNYGPGVQHIYKLADDETPIHVAPEFLSVNNLFDIKGNLTPDINIYISEI